jgi:hypothetical protein
MTMFRGDPKITRRLRSGFLEALDRYAHRPDVTGVDLGYKIKNRREQKRICVRVHVREKVEKKALTRREVLPDTIRGVGLDVVQAVYAEQVTVAAPPVGDRRRKRDPLQPGISVGCGAAAAGTIGALARDRSTGRDCLICAAHVLVPGLPDRNVVQPARQDDAAPGHGIATLWRYNPQVDAAIAMLDGERACRAEQFESGAHPTQPRDPILGEILEKSGRSTSITRARVQGIGHFGALRPAFLMVPIAGGATRISEGGDSGALWYSPADGRAVGLHCKGLHTQTDGREAAVASFITEVLGALDVDLI